MNKTYCTCLATSVGEIMVFWNQKGNMASVESISLPEQVHGTDIPIPPAAPEISGKSHTDINLLCLTIQEFLKGLDIEIPLKGFNMDTCPPFQRKVLAQTCRIPKGKVMSYGQLAETIGNPKSARAVGTALAKNPFPLIIPCHRVVRAGGDLGGYGGGLKLKESLLEMEGVIFNQPGKVSKECFLTPQDFSLPSK